MMVMVMGEFELDVGYYGLSKKNAAATPGKEKKKEERRPRVALPVSCVKKLVVNCKQQLKKISQLTVLQARTGRFLLGLDVPVIKPIHHHYR